MYKRLSIGILIVAGLITAFAAYRLSLLGFDYNFESFFPRNDKDTEFFKDYRTKFGTDNDFVLIGIRNEGGIFQKEFLDKLKRLTDTIKTLPDVKEVLSPVTIQEPIRDPLLGTITEIPYLRYDQPETYSKDSVRIFRTPELVGNLFGEDGKSVCLIISHTELIEDKECGKITDNVAAMQGVFQFDEYHYAGRCIGQHYYTNVMKIDLVVLLAAAFAVIIIVMSIIYRSVIGVALPVLVVALTVVWTMAIMELTGKRIDVLANAVPTILVVTGLSVAVHVVTKYIDHLMEGWDKFSSLKDTITHVGLANILTTVTTVVGFATLPTSGIKPIDDFGIYTAVGVVISFIIGYTVLPALLFLLPPPKKFGNFNPKFTWHNFLLTLFTFVINRKWWIVGAFSLLIVGMLIGSTRVRENTYLLEDLSNKSKLKKDFLFFEHEFQGTRPFEMAVWVKDTGKTVFDRDVLVSMEKMENFLKEDYGMKYVLSPVSIVKAANRTMAGGDPQAYLLPESDSRLDKIVRELKAFRSNKMVKSVLTEDLRMARFRAIIPDIGSRKAHKQSLRFKEFMASNSELVAYKMTGTAELIDKNNRSLIWNMSKSMAIALTVVSIIFWILFRSWRMVFIGLIPNLIPLMIMAGTMGYVGISMKMSTSILFTIAFGIAVDDTVHFLSKLRLEMRNERSLIYAVKRTYLTTGKAMIIMTLLLCVGFLVLSLSSFQAVKMIGIMVSFTLFMAMINEIILMPVLLIFFYGGKKSKSAEIVATDAEADDAKA